ncbi:MAG: hypothetical protein BYD32DRAFT_209829 [Podila humilis]|nr:MAG: hypothetical protein BYD32DRAFT_209829 [Podila humilis]
MHGISTLVPTSTSEKKRRVTILHFKLYFSSSGTSHFPVVPGRSRGAFEGEDSDFLSSLQRVREWKDNGEWTQEVKVEVDAMENEKAKVNDKSKFSRKKCSSYLHCIRPLFLDECYP